MAAIIKEVLCQGGVTKGGEGAKPEIHVHFPKRQDIRKKIKGDYLVSHVFTHSAKTTLCWHLGQKKVRTNHW